MYTVHISYVVQQWNITDERQYYHASSFWSDNKFTQSMPGDVCIVSESAPLGMADAIHTHRTEMSLFIVLCTYIRNSHTNTRSRMSHYVSLMCACSTKTVFISSRILESVSLRSTSVSCTKYSLSSNETTTKNEIKKWQKKLYQMFELRKKFVWYVCCEEKYSVHSSLG